MATPEGRWVRRWCAALLLLATGCARLPGEPDPADEPERPDKVLDFAKLFKKNCSGCHGADGTLGPGPALNDATFRAIVAEDDLRLVVAAGRKGTSMPGFARHNGGTLTAEQIEVLVRGIKTHWGAGNAPKDCPPYALQGKGDAAHGKVIFDKTCAKCHGTEEKPGKRGVISEAAFLGVTSDQLLRRTMITGRADLAAKMPGYGDLGLSSQDIEDVTAWLATKRHVSAGK
jgi:cytochrome c oxidase cbb3-type subunit 3/ubiquinol-cytochrome c reductase cytochrome c subunit